MGVVDMLGVAYSVRHRSATVQYHTALFPQICFTGKWLKYLSTKWVPQKTKNVALEKFWDKTTLKPYCLKIALI